MAVFKLIFHFCFFSRASPGIHNKTRRIIPRNGGLISFCEAFVHKSVYGGCFHKQCVGVSSASTQSLLWEGSTGAEARISVDPGYWDANLWHVIAIERGSDVDPDTVLLIVPGVQSATMDIMSVVSEQFSAPLKTKMVERMILKA